MNRHLLSALLLSTGLLGAEPEKVFDGTSLDGWKVQGGNCWTVVDGILTGENDAKKHNSVLWTEKAYGDFTVALDFRFSGDIDSGVFLRHENDQIQIGTSRSLQRDMTGSPYIGTKRGYPQEAEGVKDLLKLDKWNRMKIKVQGDRYVVVLNGEQVIDYTSDTAKKVGPIGLQVHPGVEMKVEFREVTVESL